MGSVLLERELELPGVCLQTCALQTLQELGGAFVTTCVIGGGAHPALDSLELVQQSTIRTGVNVCAPYEGGVVASLHREELRIMAREQIDLRFLRATQSADALILVAGVRLGIGPHGSTNAIERANPALEQCVGDLPDCASEDVLALHVVHEKEWDENHPDRERGLIDHLRSDRAGDRSFVSQNRAAPPLYPTGRRVSHGRG